MLWKLMNWKRLNEALTTGCGTQCSGLVDEVVISQRLDLMILMIFCNLNNSTILDIVGEEQEGRAQEWPGLMGSLLLHQMNP